MRRRSQKRCAIVNEGRTRRGTTHELNLIATYLGRLLLKEARAHVHKLRLGQRCEQKAQKKKRMKRTGHEDGTGMKEKKDKHVGQRKGNQMKVDKPVNSQTPFKNLLQNA